MASDRFPRCVVVHAQTGWKLSAAASRADHPTALDLSAGARVRSKREELSLSPSRIPNPDSRWRMNRRLPECGNSGNGVTMPRGATPAESDHDTVSDLWEPERIQLLAVGTDYPAVRAEHATSEDRRGDVRVRGPGPGCDPQLQHRRVRLAVSEVLGRPAAEVHPAGHLHAIAAGQVAPEPGEPTVVIYTDEFGWLNLQPRPGRMWTEVGGKNKDPKRGSRRRLRATYTRRQGIRHLLAAYDLAHDRFHGHVKVTRNRTTFLGFCRYLRSLYPPDVRIAIICAAFSPHLTTKATPTSGIGRPRPTSRSPTLPPTPAG